MVLGRVKIFDNAVNDNKLEVTAGNTIQLKAGEKFTVLDEDGFTLLEADNDTKEIKIKGNLGKV